MSCQNQCDTARLQEKNEKMQNLINSLEHENEKLKKQIQDIDDLLDDIAQFRIDKGALKAAIKEAVELLTDPHITDGDIDEAIRLLKKAKDI